MKPKQHVTTRALALACCLALAGLLAACGGSSTSGSDGATTVTLRLDFIHTGKDAIWTYGIEKGYFEDVGINLQIKDGKGSATTGQTVGSGSDDFGLVEGGTLISLVAEGVPLKAVMSVFDQSPVAVLSPADSPITKPQQLEGKKMAITAGDGPSTLLSALLDVNGVDKSTITMVNLQPQAKLTSLLSGRVDAVATISLTQAILAAQGLETHAMYYHEHGVPTPGYYLVTSSDYLSSHQDLVKRFVSAAQKSLQATLENPDAAVDSFVAAYPNADRAQTKAELETVLDLISGPKSADKPIGWMPPELAESTGKLLAKLGAIKQPAPVESYITNQYVK